MRKKLNITQYISLQVICSFIIFFVLLELGASTTNGCASYNLAFLVKEGKRKKAAGCFVFSEKTAERVFTFSVARGNWCVID